MVRSSKYVTHTISMNVPLCMLYIWYTQILSINDLFYCFILLLLTINFKLSLLREHQAIRQFAVSVTSKPEETQLKAMVPFNAVPYMLQVKPVGYSSVCTKGMPQIVAFGLSSTLFVTMELVSKLEHKCIIEYNSCACVVHDLTYWLCHLKRIMHCCKSINNTD